MEKHASVYGILLSVFLFFLYSCTPESCKEETVTLLGATFYRTGTGKTGAPDSVTVFGTGKETSPLYKNATGKPVIYLPLDPSSGECSFILKINGINDTIKFIYNTFPHLVSKECGYTFFHNISGCKFTENIIDTVFVTNKRITTQNEENIRIFY